MMLCNRAVLHPQPCAHGGRCVLKGSRSYTCICMPGWSGHNCHINVNDCVQHWCQNGATCLDEVDSYRWVLKNLDLSLGHSGPRKSMIVKKYDIYWSTAWGFQRISFSLYLTFRVFFYFYCVTSCLCPRGYTGLFCEQDIDYCVGHACSEHGVCLDQRYNFTCRCMPGFEGSLCELEINECSSFPCASGATCVDLISDYLCHCPPGFEGMWLSDVTESLFTDSTVTPACTKEQAALFNSRIEEYITLTYRRFHIDMT